MECCQEHKFGSNFLQFQLAAAKTELTQADGLPTELGHACHVQLVEKAELDSEHWLKLPMACSCHAQTSAHLEG